MIKAFKGFNKDLQCTSDGKTIKPDTYYTLKNGKFTEVE